MSSSGLSAKINSLRGDAEMWKHVSLKLTNDMFNIRVLQQFLQQAKTSGLAEAEDWLEENYADDPTTSSIDESITKEQLDSIYKKLNNGQSFEEVDISAIETSQQEVANAFRSLYGRQIVAQMQVDAIGTQIDNLHSAAADNDVNTS